MRVREHSDRRGSSRSDRDRRSEGGVCTADAACHLNTCADTHADGDAVCVGDDTAERSPSMGFQTNNINATGALDTPTGADQLLTRAT